MNPAIVVAIVGVLGTIIGTIISYYISTKDYRLKLKEFERNDYVCMLDKYRDMYDEMETKVNKLEAKIEVLERENHQLKTILANNGIQTVSLTFEQEE